MSGVAARGFRSTFTNAPGILLAFFPPQEAPSVSVQLQKFPRSSFQL